MVTSASYPGSYTPFGVDEVDQVDVVFANHVNQLRAEMLAVQKTLGLNPQGYAATVVARLGDMDGSAVHLAGAETISGAKTFNGGLAASQIHIPSPVTITSAAQSSLQLGLLSGPNLAVGSNGLDARSNGAPATLSLNPTGGTVSTGGQLTVGNSGTGAVLAGDISVNKVRITANGDATLGGTAHQLQVGQTSASHLVIDGNEIQGRAAGGTAASQIWLNNQGGPVQVGGTFILADYGNSVYLRVQSTGGVVITNNMTDMLTLRADGTTVVNRLQVNLGNVTVVGGNVITDSATMGMAANGNGGLIAAGGNGDVAVQLSADLVTITNRAMNAYRPIKASAFTVSSSAAVKKQVHALPFNPLDVVNDAPPRIWRYRAAHADDSVQHVGPMIEDLPAELVLDGDGPASFDIASLVGTLWGAVGELSAKVDRLTDRLSDLEPA